jgi:hypothetical protein
MKKIILFLLSLVLVSCGRRNLDAYKDVISRTDRMVVTKDHMANSIVFSSPEMLSQLKDIFTRNIKPLDVDTVFADELIFLYDQGRQIGLLRISNAEKPVVGFYTDSLVLSFRMTYGIAMFLSEVSAGNYW